MNSKTNCGGYVSANSQPETQTGCCSASRAGADVESALVSLKPSVGQNSARRYVRLAQRLRRAEQRRFVQGKGTLFVLNKRKQSLAKA